MMTMLVRGRLWRCLPDTSSYSASFCHNDDCMKDEKKEQDARAKFYTSQSVARYINVNGVPKSKHAFRDMVEAGTSEKLDGERGQALIASLGEVVFFTHPQQINVMDKSNLKIIASITR